MGEFPDGDILLRNVARYSTGVVNTSGEEGKDIIKQEEYQLRYDWDQTRNQARQYQKTLKKCIDAWEDYQKSESSMTSWIANFQMNIDAEGKKGDKSVKDL